MGLSLAMIVKNEAARLPRCLSSVKNVVDELVIVDTGSSDDTVAIAQSFGATVYPWTWTDDFAAARNYGLAQTHGDWILVLDADEVLIPDCVPALERLLKQPNCLAVTLLREEVGAAQSPYSLVSRLFRRHPDLYFQRPFHELIDDSVAAVIAAEPQWRVGTLPQPALRHDGYQATTIAARRKTERAARIMGRYLQAHPNDRYICSKLGGLYVTQGNLAAGIALLERGLQGDPLDANSQYELHYHAALAYAATGNLPFAQQHYEQALSLPLDPHLKLAAWINLSALYQAQGQFPQAEALLRQVLDIAPHLAIAHYNLGLLQKAQGNLKAAIAAYQQAIAIQPNYPEAQQNLGVVFYKLGRVAESHRAFLQAITLYETLGSPEAQRLRQALTDLGLA